MPQIPYVRPISDWRNNQSEMTRLIDEADGPVIMTVNGRGRYVCMSMANYEKERFNSEVYAKLKDAEAQRDAEAATVPIAEAMGDIRKRKERL